MELTDFEVVLDNQWNANFRNQGEVAMGTEGFNLELVSPSGQKITYFENKIVLLNCRSVSTARECLVVTENGKYGLVKFYSDESWIINFENQEISPYRLRIKAKHEDEVLSALEQPCFLNFKEWITFRGKVHYLTFPFGTEEEIKKMLAAYLTRRQKQLKELYFFNDYSLYNPLK